MTKYDPVIGLEVHVGLNTKSKMFCRCSADYFGKEPNTHTCPVCLGLPGALPYINEEAINKCIQIGLALNCKILPTSLFERKNYFYPDLAKGYQVSQYRWPLSKDGWIKIEDEHNNLTKIRINRVHQEEDTGKLTHSDSDTLIDFNRSGIPLVEIVTEPDFSDTAQIKNYAKWLQQLFRYLGVSQADMERGDMRLEANISLRKFRQKELPLYRIELKNINSFKFMVEAIQYEIKRQIELLERGEKLTQETRGWNEDKKCTFLQRSKEEAHDYRYFPEPDLPQMTIDNKHLAMLKEELPEMPWDKLKRFTQEFKLAEVQAKILSETKELAAFFEQAVKIGKNHGVGAVQVANHIINKKVNIEKILPKQIVEEIEGKKVGVIDNPKELEKLANQAINENPQAVKDYQTGREAAIQVLIGVVMKLSLGKADASKTKEILIEQMKLSS